ncbi:cob(I)yrinic acid a,c-diamide adenosyltransferase [Natronobiforma cellulositropha]|uniref:cob(I)yrinic acid a,c-diamide adenosyltransferase n=1 Tax=Natronobiforma cellulositropha TaxID=1679076 RepID=UPI0021D5A52F|nr:cob(I)yrinic acid a,c-diamide adenosyltransferase [Natronobiforma cellulositropha]
MSIYTGRGDEGQTDLRDMTRVSKASERIESYGTVDELNALVGTIRPAGYDDVDDHLERIQNHLHILQAELAAPGETDAESHEGGESGASAADGPTLAAEHVAALESWIDGYDEELEPLRSFVLPGGSEHGARTHHARAVCRRAERRVVALAAVEPVSPVAVEYLNRLSDALFTIARVLNQRDGVPETPPSYS